MDADTPKKTILVTGGAGGVGLVSSLFFAEQGWGVTALVAPWDEKGRIETLQKSGVKIFTGDIRNAGEVERAFSGQQALLHTVALMPSASDADAVHNSTNVGGSENALRLAHKSGVQRAVFISTAGVATHHREGTAYDDESAPYRLKRNAHNAHIRSKIAAEKMLDRVSQELGYPVVILRPASIYGKGMRFRWPEIFDMVRTGKMRLIGGGNFPYPLIHAKDLARAARKAVELSVLQKTEKFIISSDEALTIGGIIDFIARYFDAPRAQNVPYIPALAAAYLLSCVPAALKPARFKLVTPGTIREYTSGHAYRTDKAKNVLGFRAEISFEQGMKEMLDDYSAKSKNQNTK